jgi:hypothetical protein
MFGRELKNRFSCSMGYVVVETNQSPVIMDRRSHERFLAEFPKKSIYIAQNGYAYFMSGSSRLLHIWIAETFLGPRTAPTVDHVNRVTTDNRIANLRWASQSLQNTNRGCVRTAATATPLPGIAPGFTSADLPRFVYYRPSAVEKTGATRGDYFAVERGDVRRKTETRKELTLLDKYYQAIAIAHEEGMLCAADDLDPAGIKLRDEAIAIFSEHAGLGGTHHPVASAPKADRPEIQEPSPSSADQSKRRRTEEDAPQKTVKLESTGALYSVYLKSGVHVICDEKNRAAAASLGDWSVERSEGASVAIRQAIRTNKKTTLKGDLADRFPAMRSWPTDKISLPEFVWCFCMNRELPEDFSVSSRNRIPGDVREANLCTVKKTGNRVPRVVVCKPPPGLEVPHGLLPIDISVAYHTAKPNSPEKDKFSNFSITGNLLKAAGVAWRGSTSVTVPLATKYEQALAKLREVYSILGRDLDAEHAEYVALVCENRYIVDAFGA